MTGRLAAGVASLAAGLTVGGPLLAAGFGGGVPSSPADSSAPTTTAGDPPTVSRDEYERVQRKSYRRLVGWRRAERQRERLKRALRFRIDYVAAGLRCIHTLEGSWSDPSPPYWGGLQMDLSFQTTYGGPLVRRYGTANHWPAEAQVAVGVVAYYAGRGYAPWPNTRRGCGL